MPPKEANLSSDSLFADMSHQIYTLMTSLIGMLELLDDTELTPPQRGFTNIAQASAGDLLALIDNLLDLSKITAGKLLLKEAPFDLLREMDIVRDARAGVAQSKEIDITLHAVPAVSRLMLGDATRIRQAVTMLLDHAIASNSKCVLRIEVSTVMQEHDRCRLQVSVTGAGNGFVQADDAIDGQHDAKRLEMILCGKLVKLMGGEAGVDSLPGQPSKAWMTINVPLASRVLSGMRILIVDDHAINRSLLEQQLGQEAMRPDSVDTASMALSALEKAALAQDPYRIVILSQEMAGIDGETLGTAIKADPVYRDTILAILSALPSASNAKRFVEAGFSAFLSKPVRHDILRDTLSILCAPAKENHAPQFVIDGISHFSFSVQDKGPRSFSGYRILVVDDNVINYQIAVRILEKLGYRADVATNGLEALSMHERQNYDLILMDCCMPELDGYQATTRIRALETGQQRTPIIAWTSTIQQDIAEKCIDAGMDDLLPKPIRPQTLQMTLARWLRPAGAPQPAAQRPEEGDELEAMQDLFGANFPELAALYQNDMPKRIASLHEAGIAGDARQVAKVAHTLCGSCASIGATQLAVLCRDLEIRYKTAELSDDFESEVEAICTEYARIDTKLQSMVRAFEG